MPFMYAGSNVVLEARLTAARAGYLDELAAGAIPADLFWMISNLEQEADALIKYNALAAELVLILADVTGIAGDAMRGTDNIKAYSEYEYEVDLALGSDYTPPARTLFVVCGEQEGLTDINLEWSRMAGGWAVHALGSAVPTENWRGPFYQTSGQKFRIKNDRGDAALNIGCFGETRAA